MVPVAPQPLPVALPPSIEPTASALPRLIVAGMALLGGLLLIVLAVPRLGAALELARAKPIYDRLQNGDSGVDDAALQATIDSLRQGFERSSEPYLGAMLAYSTTAQAERTADPALAGHRFALAADAARATIRVSPSNLIAWTLLATSLDARDPRDPAALAALVRTIHIAPYDPRLRDVRISLAMRHWSRLDAATRRLAAVQITRAAQSNPRSLAELARNSLGLPAVHESLRDDPALRTRFNKVYVSLPR